MSRPPERRLLLVHAHPDDESITNGVTMARYASTGAGVTLVTCTLGEEGEVIPPTLAHLAEARPPRTAAVAREPELTPLAAYRRKELDAALTALGVTDHRLLGGPGRYRDSGMMGAPENDHPQCLWQAPTNEAAALLVDVVREVRPQVLVTYDPDGGYGHPDHIKAHRIAMRAVELAADPAYRPAAGRPHTIARCYWNCVPRSVLEERLARLRSSDADCPFPQLATSEDVPGVVEDHQVAVAVEGSSAETAAKAAALRAHATQITVADDCFALSNDLGQPLLGTEYFRSADGRVPATGRQDDLFAGLVTP